MSDEPTPVRRRPNPRPGKCTAGPAARSNYSLSGDHGSWLSALRYCLVSMLVEHQALIGAFIFLDLPVRVKLEHGRGRDRRGQRLRILECDYIFQRVEAHAVQALHDVQRVAMRRDEIENRRSAEAHRIDDQYIALPVP